MRKSGYVQFVDGNKITVDGEKYSAFAISQIKCRAGDFVDFEYIEKPSVTRAGTPVVYKNIKGDVMPNPGMPVSTLAGATTIPAPPRGFTPPPAKVGEPILAKERLILRQNALTAAVNYCNTLWSFTGKEPTTELVIEVAKKFEYYTSGDMDYDAAEKALEGDKVD